MFKKYIATVLIASPIEHFDLLHDNVERELPSSFIRKKKEQHLTNQDF